MLSAAILVLICVILFVGSVIVLVHLASSIFNVAPQVWTPQGALDEVVDALDLRDTASLCDLGCGSGQVLLGALKRRSAIKAVGVDNDPVILLLARWRLGRRAKLVRSQIEDFELAGYDRIFVYLKTGLMAELEPRFERELGKGARVVALQYPLPNRQPIQEITLKHGKPYASRLFIYAY